MGFARKWAYTLFSVQPLCALCLCGSLLLRKNNHRDTEHTEVAQRRSRIETFVQSRINRDSLVTKGTSTNVFLITCAWLRHYSLSQAELTCQKNVSVIGCAPIKWISPKQEDVHANARQSPARRCCSDNDGRGDSCNRVVPSINTTSCVAVVHSRTDQELSVSKRADCLRNGLADRVGIQRAGRA